MKMKWLVGSFAVVAALMLSLAVNDRPAVAGQDDTVQYQFKALATSLGDLTARVARIEHAMGAYLDDDFEPRVGRRDVPGAVAGRYMVIDNVQTSVSTVDNSRDIAELRRDIDSLERTLERQQDRLAQIKSESSARSAGRDDNDSDYERSRRERRLRAQQSVVRRYGRQLASKRTELVRLERAAGEPRQLIHGHADEVIIVLETDRDLSAALTDITIGDAVTWNGRRLSMDADSERWMINTLGKLAPVDD